MGYKAPVSLLLVTCILFASRIHVVADIRLEPINGSVRRGTTYTFTLRVSQPDIRTRGLVSWRRGDPQAVLCDLSIATGQMFLRPVPGYDCRAGEDQGSYFLDIRNVSKHDFGIWSCQYWLNLSNNVTLDVKFPPTIEIQPVAPCKTFTYSVIDRNVSLNCMVISGNPAPTVFRWYHNNLKVGDSQMFVIPTVKRSSEGLYRCEADNSEAPNGRDTVTVSVHYKPEIKSFGIWTVDGQADDTVSEHANITFRCEVDSHPLADIQIEKVGKLVNQNTDGSSLIVKCEDRGNYTCSAKNLLGEVKSETKQLLVTCKPRPADGSSEVINLAATLNGSVEFQVEVIAYPKPLFTLRKSETQTSEVNHINPTWDGLVATGTITLYNIRSDQFGSYILRVNNTEGELDYKIDLRLKSKPEKPGNLQVYNVKTRSLSLSWEKGFNGGAVQTFSVEYRKNGKQWIKNPIILSEQDDLQLDLHGLEPSSDYEIRVSASNVYGRSDHIYINTWTRCDRHKQLDVYTGLGIGIAAMMGIVGFCLILVIIFRKNVGLFFLGSKAAQRTYSLEAAAAEVHELRTVDLEAEDDGYETPGNKLYEDLGERTVEPPNTYEQLKIYQNQ